MALVACQTVVSVVDERADGSQWRTEMEEPRRMALRERLPRR
jgi:hypothetical protein